MDTIGQFIPRDFVPEGRMLSAGELTVTVTSKATLHHVTLRFRCTTDGEDTVPFHRASHIAVENYDGLRIATYYPAKGEIAFNPFADKAARWATTAILRWAAGEYPNVTRHALIDSEDIEELLALA